MRGAVDSNFGDSLYILNIMYKWGFSVNNSCQMNILDTYTPGFWWPWRKGIWSPRLTHCKGSSRRLAWHQQHRLEKIWSQKDQHGFLGIVSLQQDMSIAKLPLTLKDNSLMRAGSTVMQVMFICMCKKTWRVHSLIQMFLLPGGRNIKQCHLCAEQILLLFLLLIQEINVQF